MAHTDVSSNVLSIIASFANGFKVFRKLRDKRSRNRRGTAKIDDGNELIRLSRSLCQGSDEIDREYRRSILGVGESCTVGNGMRISC